MILETAIESTEIGLESDRQIFGGGQKLHFNSSSTNCLHSLTFCHISLKIELWNALNLSPQ